MKFESTNLELTISRGFYTPTGLTPTNVITTIYIRFADTFSVFISKNRVIITITLRIVLNPKRS